MNYDLEKLYVTEDDVIKMFDRICIDLGYLIDGEMYDKDKAEQFILKKLSRAETFEDARIRLMYFMLHSHFQDTIEKYIYELEDKDDDIEDMHHTNDDEDQSLEHFTVTDHITADFKDMLALYDQDPTHLYKIYEDKDRQYSIKSDKGDWGYIVSRIYNRNAVRVTDIDGNLFFIVHYDKETGLTLKDNHTSFILNGNEEACAIFDQDLDSQDPVALLECHHALIDPNDDEERKTSLATCITSNACKDKLLMDILAVALVIIRQNKYLGIEELPEA